MDKLMEELKILAGIKESVEVEDELPKYLEEQQRLYEIEKQRELNEKKTVLNNFDEFKNKIEEEKKILEMISKLFENDNKRNFINGLIEDKYQKLRKFADIVINDGYLDGLVFLKENINEIKEEIKKIEYLAESENEKQYEIYFLSEDIVSGDNVFGIEYEVYKDKLLEEKMNDINLEYGSEFALIDENLALMKQDGKKYYVKIKTQDFKKLIENNILV
jgi:hypothetical protein